MGKTPQCHLGLLILFTVVVASGCASGPGKSGGDPSGPEAMKRLQARLAALQRTQESQRRKIGQLKEGQKRMEKALPNLEGLPKRLARLGEKVHDLRGGSKVNGHELERLSAQLNEEVMRIRSRIGEIEERLQRLEEGSRKQKGEGAESRSQKQEEATSTATRSAGRAADEKAYRAAFQKLRLGKYKKATVSFREFLSRFPKSEYADNALYWLGEGHYVQGDYEAALEAFRKVPREHPDSSKVPASMLKMGYSYYELEDYRMARKTLLRLTDNHPDHRVAELAKKRLERIRKEQL